MLDFFHLPVGVKADVQVFQTTGVASAMQVWNKPRGVSMVAMFLVGAGGNGGNGAVGASGSAAGGGGGASGGQTFVCVPAHRVPDRLHLLLSSDVSVLIAPTDTALNRFALARVGGNGGNASGATAGTAGATATAAAIADCPLAALGVYNFIGGQGGAAGGSIAVPPVITLPTTGLVVTGGTGGSGVIGTNAGGSFSIAGGFPTQNGGIAPTVATDPGGNGSNGFNFVIAGLRYSYGGTGGSSSNSVATGSGLFGGNGGAGGTGCGGGGGGGCLTGGVAGVGGRGGPGQITMAAW